MYSNFSQTLIYCTQKWQLVDEIFTCNSIHSQQISSHLTDCSLHYCIQTSLRRVQVARDFLFANFSFKLLGIVSQWQDILKTESWLAGISTIGAGVLTSFLHLTDIWQHLLINKRSKTWKMEKGLRINDRNIALVQPLPIL